MTFLTHYQPNEIDLIIIYISICLGVGGFVHCFLRNFLVGDFRIPYGTILLILGVLLGIISVSSDNLNSIVAFIFYHRTFDFIALSFPSFIFKMAFQMDVHIFLKSFTQILTISIFGFAINCLILGLITTYNVDSDFAFSTTITLGLITSVIDTKDTTKFLGQFKNLGVLLAGEEMITSSISLFMYDAILHLDRSSTKTDVVSYVFLKMIIGIVVGSMVGKLFTCLVSWDRCDFSTIVTMSLFLAYAMFYGVRLLLGGSGIITVAVFGITICCNKGKITAEIERSLFQFWHLMYSFFNFILYIQAGVLVVLADPSSGLGEDIIAVFMIYLVCLLTRSLILLILSPILSRIGYGLNWRNGVVLVWGALKGSSTLLLALNAFADTTKMDQLGNKIMIYSVGLVLLHLTINGTTVRKLVKLLGFTTISTVKISNMNSIIGYVMSARDRSINVLKMNKLYADAAWDAVREATKIIHPYKAALKQEGEFKEGEVKDISYSVCPECKTEIPLEPTAKELQEIRKEAYLRVLKAKKVSYLRQFEWGMMSKDAHRTLVSIVNDALEKKTGLIDIDSLKNLWKPRGSAAFIRNKLVKLMPKKELKVYIKSPLRSWQTHLYKIVNSLWWEYCLFLIIILIIISFTLDLIYRPQFKDIDQLILVSISTICFIILVTFTVFKMFAVGCNNYMRSAWHMVDVLTVTLSFFYIFYVYKFFLEDNNDKTNHLLILCLSAARMIYAARFFRLCFVIQATIPKIVELLDRKIDVHLAHGYDVGKGFITGEDEVLKLLPKFVADTKVLAEIKIKLEADRLAVTKEIGILQRNRPTITITVKTKEAMSSVLHVMKTTTKDLKDGGVLDEEEYSLMSKAINDRYKYIRKRFLSIAPCPPDVLLRQVSWLIDDEDTAIFLLTHSLMVNLNYEEILIKAEEEPQGIYVIVSGIARMDFFPNLKKLESLERFGALPNVDYPNVMDYRERQEDYIVSGNVIGEIGILTGRTHDASIICESSVQAYFISIDAMKYAIRSQAGNFNGLQQRIWKAVSVRLACVILPAVPTYQSWTQEKLQRYLERSFVPKLNPTKTFFFGDIIEAVLLIEGRALDVINKDVYFAPSYIPRTVQKLNFASTPPGSEYKVEPILLVVPAEDIDEQDLMDYLEGDNDMRTVTSVALLQRKHLLPTRKPEIRKRNKVALGIMDIERGGIRAIRADSEAFENFRRGLNTTGTGWIRQNTVERKVKEEEEMLDEKQIDPERRKDSYWESEKDENEDMQESRFEASKSTDELPHETTESPLYSFSYFNYKTAYDTDSEIDDDLSSVTIHSKNERAADDNKTKVRKFSWIKKTDEGEKSKSNQQERKPSSDDTDSDNTNPKPGTSNSN